VVVVGAGIAGLTTALLLARAGRRVIVLEALRIGAGTSGRTTAKASALQGSKYQRITQHHGVAAARRYAASQLDALAWMRDHVETASIDCAWEDRPAVTYAETDDGRTTVHDELAAAFDAGLAVEPLTTDLPFPTSAAIGLADQAQFDPQAYLAALAAQVAAEPSASIHEGSRVTSIGGLRRHEVRTADGTVRCGAVVVATLMPIVDRGLFFARSHPKSSYLVALRANGPLPHGMYLSTDPLTRSLRTAHDAEGKLLLVGGQGHTTGRGAPTLARYQELANWAAVRFPVESVAARWSAHDVVPADHLPWVGSSSPLTPNVVVASGFDKWGMTMGTAAALVLADRLTGESTGRTAEWSGLFDPSRMGRRGIVETVRINTEVGSRLVADWAHPDADPGTDGRGRRHRGGLVPVGEPERSSSTEVDVVCTHLGGVCSWNDGDATWDCPLHGSRFEAEGTVLAGPAVRRLRKRRTNRPGSSAELEHSAGRPASSGYLVTDRAGLLDELTARGFVPAHAEVIADHVTYQADDPAPAPPAAVFSVDGFVRDGAVDALVGAVDGQRIRPDGRAFHITVSVAPGHHPVESNDAIEAGLVQPFDPPFDVALQRF
jgi:glycine/D-amino acid oxidase-like deaminating enzyme